MGACLSPPAGAARPWRPQVEIGALPRHPSGRIRLDARARARFDDLFARGKRLLDQGQYDLARPLLAEAKKIDPDDVSARKENARLLLTLGYLGWKRELVEEAQRDLRHARALEPLDGGLKELDSLIQGLLLRMERTPGRRPAKKDARAER